MATYTSNYGWTKPSGSDNVDISVLNDNLDEQDSTIHDAFLNMAPPFSESSTYAVDDIVLYGTGLYKCHTAVVTPGSWTGSTNWQVYKLSEGGGGGGGTSNYNDLTNKPSINGVTLSGNKTTSNLGIDKTAVGLGNVPNVSTNDQTPTFTQASTRNNIASGEKLSVILGKIAKFFNDLKTVAFSGSFSDLSNKPSINGVELSGNKTAGDLGLQSELTFDNVPTDGSNNPVKSNGIYDALALKQDATDNNLDTEAKTIVGAINEHEGDIDSLKSGLTNYENQNNLNLEVPNRKNILPMTVDIIKSLNTSGTWSGNSYTFFGVTYTVSTNSDGYVTSVALSGTASGGGGLELGSYTASDYAGKIMSGCPSGGSKGTFYLYGQWSDTNHGWIRESDDIGSGCILEYNSGDVYFEPQIYVKKGTNVSGKTFYPMVRPNFITNSTFAPYIPSVESRIEAVESGLTNLIITHSYTKNSDGAGRVIIPLPLDDIISVKVSANYGYFLRYLSNGNQTLLYMRDPDTWASIGEVSDISITVKALS